MNPPGSQPQEELARWRRELAAAYGGTPMLPVTISLARHARELSIPQAYFEELIKGVEMDLTTTRYATFEQLSLYCYRVASVVGLICLHVFGTTSPRAQDYAVNLGMAFQLTNILRDLGNDAECGRVYLPQEDFTRFGYREEDLLQRRYKPEFTELMIYEVGRAKEFYAKAARALESLPREERQALTVAEIMRGVYSRILQRIEQSGYRVLGDRVTLTPATVWRWRPESGCVPDFLLRPMSRSVLILGGGIAGLTAALALAAKGHSVTVIEQGAHLGGRMWHAPPPVLLEAHGATWSLIKSLGQDAVTRPLRHTPLNFCNRPAPASSSSIFPSRPR